MGLGLLSEGQTEQAVEAMEMALEMGTESLRIETTAILALMEAGEYDRLNGWYHNTECDGTAFVTDDDGVQRIGYAFDWGDGSGAAEGDAGVGVVDSRWSSWSLNQGSTSAATTTVNARTMIVTRTL